MTGNELIEKFHKTDWSKPMYNSMGCNENWYDPIYSVHESFAEEEIRNMNEKEIDNLIKLAQTISDGLY